MLLVAIAAAGYRVSAVCEPRPAPVHVVVQTDLGEIDIEIDSGACASHRRKLPEVCRRRSLRWRAVSSDGPSGQSARETGEDRRDPGRGTPGSRAANSSRRSPLERTNKTGLLHKDGTVRWRARRSDTATDEFFICVGDQPELDFGGKRNPDGQGFAAFGRVVRGMDVVRRIQEAPADGETLASSDQNRQGPAVERTALIESRISCLQDLPASPSSRCSSLSPPQSQTDEIAALRREVQALKAQQARWSATCRRSSRCSRASCRRGASRKRSVRRQVRSPSTDAPTKGNAAAKVTLVEVSDYHCPFCRRQILQTMPQLLADYVNSGKVQVRVRRLPDRAASSRRLQVARSGGVRRRSGKYWQMHDLLFTNSPAREASQLHRKCGHAGRGHQEVRGVPERRQGRPARGRNPRRASRACSSSASAARRSC